MSKSGAFPTPTLRVVQPPAGKAAGAVQPLSPVPLYAQIKEILRARILDGTYQPHQQMPSESEMMAAFNVSRITVRQALDDLQNEGLIFKIHGKGTFVSKPKAFQRPGAPAGLRRGDAADGLRDLLARARASRRVTAADAGGRAAAGRAERARVTELQRVRFLNREPISLDVTYLPHGHRRAPGARKTWRRATCS